METAKTTAEQIRDLQDQILHTLSANSDVPMDAMATVRSIREVRDYIVQQERIPADQTYGLYVLNKLIDDLTELSIIRMAGAQ